MLIQFDENNPEAVQQAEFLFKKGCVFYIETTDNPPIPFKIDGSDGVTIDGATPFPCPEQAIMHLRTLIKKGHRNYVVKECSATVMFTPEMIDEWEKDTEETPEMIDEWEKKAEENGPTIATLVEPFNHNIPAPIEVNHPGNVTIIPLAPNKLGVMVDRRPWNGVEHEYKVRCKRVIPGSKLPEYAKDGDSGLDVFAPYNFSIGPGEQLLVMTGWAFELPQGMEFQARPKSGLAVKGEITMTNTPGTIDSNYRGEVGFILRNLSSHKTWGVLAGEKIGQLVLCPVFQAVLEEVDELDETERGAGGFGSTGK